MSKITVTTIAGLTSGGDANTVKIESGDAFNVVSGATTLGGDLTVDTNVLKVDASNDRVGIGTASPTQTLETAGNIFINTTGNPNLTVKTSGAGNNPNIRIQADTNYWDLQTLFSNTNDELDFRYNGNSKMMINKEGLVTKPGQPNFLARPNANDTVAYGGSKIAHDEAIHNIGNHYNTSNQRFTAPVAGIYYFEHIIVMSGSNAGTLEAKIYVNGVERSRSYHRYDGNQDSDRTSRFIQLAAADYVEPYCHWSSSNLNTLNAGSTAMMITSFSGYLMQ